MSTEQRENPGNCAAKDRAPAGKAACGIIVLCDGNCAELLYALLCCARNTAQQRIVLHNVSDTANSLHCTFLAGLLKDVKGCV